MSCRTLSSKYLSKTTLYAQYDHHIIQVHDHMLNKEYLERPSLAWDHRPIQRLEYLKSFIEKKNGGLYRSNGRLSATAYHTKFGHTSLGDWCDVQNNGTLKCLLNP
jgi:hypothetical protein